VNQNVLDPRLKALAKVVGELLAQRWMQHLAQQRRGAASLPAAVPALRTKPDDTPGDGDVVGEDSAPQP
jgi:hypothetical protein